MIAPSAAPQGGATPRPLPARPGMLRALVASGSRNFRGLPALVRAGAAFLGLGIAGDVGYHLTHGIRLHSHAPSAFDPAMVIHLMVGAGMGLCMAGVIAAGVRSARSHPRRFER